MLTPKFASPVDLLQEKLRDDPWKLLVCCMCLNKTNNKQVKRVIFEFFDRWPVPSSISDDDFDDMSRLLKPLGFYNRRTRQIIKFSKKYVGSNWNDPLELPGVGKYASDSYKMFVEGTLDVEPTDKKLKEYIDWTKTLATDHA